MGIPIQVLKPGGQVEPAAYHASSLNHAAELEPEGVYTVARTYQVDRAVLLDAHFDRLEESARLTSSPVCLDRQRIRSALRNLIQGSGNPESRFRITLPGAAPEEVILAIEPLAELPASYYQEGVTAACYPVRRDNPLAKTNNWVHLREQARASLPRQVYEVIAVGPDQRLLEGFSSNFYAVLDGALRMEPDRALAGIARKIVLEIVQGWIPIKMQAVSLDDLQRLQEAFMSSSGRGVIPLVEIDETLIGGGSPGSVTREIQSRYASWVEAHLEPI